MDPLNRESTNEANMKHESIPNKPRPQRPTLTADAPGIAAVTDEDITWLGETMSRFDVDMLANPEHHDKILRIIAGEAHAEQRQRLLALLDASTYAGAKADAAALRAEWCDLESLAIDDSRGIQAFIREWFTAAQAGVIQGIMVVAQDRDGHVSSGSYGIVDFRRFVFELEKCKTMMVMESLAEGDDDE